MKHIINRLDQWIRENRAEYYRDLNPGLSDSEIKDWEDKFGFEFPEDFKTLYQWRNGQRDQRGENREYFVSYHFFNDIEMVYGQWEFGNDELVDFNEDGIIAWGKSWLRFLCALNDDGYCLDVDGNLGEPGNIIYFIHDGDNDVVYPNLKTMMEIIVNQFELGAYGYKLTDCGETTFELIDQEKADKIYDDFIK